VRISISDTYGNSDGDVHANSHSNGNSNGNCNRYSYSYGKCNADRYRHSDSATSISNPDGDGYSYRNAAVYPDAKAASDASAASDALTLIGMIKAGTRERDSRVPRVWRIGLTRAVDAAFSSRGWHFTDATPGGLNTAESMPVATSRAESNRLSSFSDLLGHSHPCVIRVIRGQKFFRKKS
jgi:hypothetical protein